MCKVEIPLHKGGNAVGNHFHRLACHFLQILLAAVPAAHFEHILRYFGYIGRLIAYPLHIRYHFKCRRYFPEILCHRLLFKQQLHTKTLYFAFLFVYFRVNRKNLFGQSRIVFGQRSYGKRYCLLAHTAHCNQLVVQIFKLLVEMCSHYPNLPVI